MIELRQLRYLVSASEAGSFNRRARKLAIKQATLSRHILQVDQRLGTIIFYRSSPGAVAVPQATALTIYAMPYGLLVEK